MDWIMENWTIISAVSTPILLFLVGWALKKVPNKYRAEALKAVQSIEKLMIEADYNGDLNAISNDDVKASVDKIKIDLGLDQ